MSARMSGNAALASALPCSACKQPVIETRSVDGAVVVLDAATKRLHLCVKRKEVEAAKARQVAATRVERPRPAKPLPPAKRPEASRPGQKDHAARAAKPARERADRATRADRPARPVRAKVAEPPRKAPPRRKPKNATLRSPQQVQEILKGKVVRWRTPTDSPTSFCAECDAPVLVGFSHVRWDVMMLDAAGHLPHDCKTSRVSVTTRHRDRLASPIDIPVVAAPVRRVVRPAPPIAPVVSLLPSATIVSKPRRRPAATVAREATANSCETCGKLTAVVNGERVCLHCGA